MQLTTIVSALVLPVLALADGTGVLSTTTMTSSMVLTKTVTLQRVVATTTMYPLNSTTSYMPTGTGSKTTFVVPTTSAANTAAPSVVPPINKNAGVQLGAAHVALAGAAGAVIAAFL